MVSNKQKPNPLTGNLDIVVIGGGAAGFFAAINCANTYRKAKVTILEATKKPLNKVRISGGGRCNVTHNCFDPARLVQNYPRGGKALRGPFSRFQPQDTVEWFANRGVKLKTEADGRMFPITNNSETVVNCLLNEAKKAKVNLQIGTAVKSVIKKENKFEINLKTGKTLKCDRILIATGSNPQGIKIAKNLGHKIIPAVPSLFTFNIKDSRLESLAGVSCDRVSIQLNCSNLSKEISKKMTQTGPILITHWGLSGPVILKLSAWGARVLFETKYQSELIINWLPEYNSETLRDLLLKTKLQMPKKKLVNYSPLPIPKRLWQSLIHFVGIGDRKIWTEISKKELNRLVGELVRGSYKISGKGVFKEEFVTCGGVSLKEVNFKTMESKISPGIYFAGEVLDIDGVTGGFNFQSAWTTGWLASQAMGQEILSPT